MYFELELFKKKFVFLNRLRRIEKPLGSNLFSRLRRKNEKTTRNIFFRLRRKMLRAQNRVLRKTAILTQMLRLRNSATAN